MMHAYSELYIEKAQISLGSMLHYAVYDLRLDLTRFFRMFIDTGIAADFGSGDPKYTVGMSGIELAGEVLFKTTGTYPDTDPVFVADRSPEYWTGWAVAYYEWYKAIPFDRIDQYVPVSQILEMYDPLHEADLSRFVQFMDSRIETVHDTSRLARLRAYAGLSQKALADMSGVSVRMIEQYEQGRKDINRASSSSVYQLSKALNCRMEDLLE